jgi:hypothetical protein
LTAPLVTGVIDVQAHFRNECLADIHDIDQEPSIAAKQELSAIPDPDAVRCNMADEVILLLVPDAREDPAGQAPGALRGHGTQAPGRLDGNGLLLGSHRVHSVYINFVLR